MEVRFPIEVGLSNYMTRAKSETLIFRICSRRFRRSHPPPMASSVRLLPPIESVSAGRPEKKKKLMSEGSDEEYGKSVGEGSEEEKMDSSVCPCGNCYCGMTEEEKQYKDTLNGLFDCEGEPEEDSDGDMMVGGIVAYLRGKFDLEGPDAEDWRRMAD